LIKGIDVSAYQINVPWAELMKHGLEFAVIKGDQMTATDNHFALARAAGVPLVGMYLWDDPIVAAQVQIDYFAKEIERVNPDFIAMDVEQWWANWQSYFDAIAGKVKWADVPKKSPAAISGHSFAVADGLRKKFPKKKIFIYSGTWFTNGYALPMLDWLGQFSLWWAHYFDGPLGTRQVTWEYLEDTPPQPFKVWMPNDKLNWTIWQYSSTMITPAQYARYDWNAFAGTLDDLRALCGLSVPVPVPEPLTIEQRVERLEKAVFPNG
jgi:GH25 family lysozyme M1 (1,4-beta-N-acetylmuramidase)